jgi:hypothetical protein
MLLRDLSSPILVYFVAKQQHLHVIPCADAYEWIAFRDVIQEQNRVDALVVQLYNRIFQRFGYLRSGHLSELWWPQNHYLHLRARMIQYLR